MIEKDQGYVSDAPLISQETRHRTPEQRPPLHYDQSRFVQIQKSTPNVRTHGSNKPNRAPPILMANIKHVITRPVGGRSPKVVSSTLYLILFMIMLLFYYVVILLCCYIVMLLYCMLFNDMSILIL